MWSPAGDPDCIPDLTYEAYLDFHRRYYHPSNSYLYLYGNMDMERELAWIDEKYLSCFEELRVESEVPLQKPFEKMQEFTVNIRYLRRNHWKIIPI